LSEKTCKILHVEAGPSFGGSTSALESYLLYGDRKRIVRDVLFHYRVPGIEAIVENSRRFICLEKSPPQADEHGAEGPSGSTAGPLRRIVRNIPGAWAIARSMRAAASFLGAEVAVALRIAREVRAGGCDLIHSNNTPTIQRSTLLAAAITKVPAVAHVRTSVSPGWLDRALMNRCRLVIAQSASVREELIDGGVRAPVVECFDGVTVPPEPFPVSDEIKGELLGTSRDTVIGTVGRLVERKGMRFLIEAISVLRKRRADLTLAVVGDGPLKEGLQQLAASSGIAGKVRFLGFRRDLRYILQAIDIFALPSLKEGLPIALLIAMAEGRPVVASSVDGIPTFVRDGWTGLLVPPGDSVRLAEALGRLLDDRALASQLGAAGRALVGAEASVKKTAAKVDELLLRAVEG
jgi:glycosyltransferase involved in cell wall biosynthesis